MDLHVYVFLSRNCIFASYLRNAEKIFTESVSESGWKGRSSGGYKRKLRSLWGNCLMLSPYSRVPEKLITDELVNKFRCFVVQILITVFSKTDHFFLSWLKWIHSASFFRISFMLYFNIILLSTSVSQSFFRLDFPLNSCIQFSCFKSLSFIWEVDVLTLVWNIIITKFTEKIRHWNMVSLLYNQGRYTIWINHISQ